jgi:hypothetical protein
MGADERDVRAARMLLASLPNAPDSAIRAIARHIAKLRDRAVDRICEVHEQADASRAAGYAEAVADIRQMLRDARDATTEGRITPGLARAEMLIDRGAHVGASKRSGT